MGKREEQEWKKGGVERLIWSRRQGQEGDMWLVRRRIR